MNFNPTASFVKKNFFNKKFIQWCKIEGAIVSASSTKEVFFFFQNFSKKVLLELLMLFFFLKNKSRK